MPDTPALTRVAHYPEYVVRGTHIPDLPKVKLDLPPALLPLPIATVKMRALAEWRSKWGAGDVTEETIDRFAREFPWRWRGDHLNRYEYLYLWAFEFMGIVYRERLQSENRQRLSRRSGDRTIEKAPEREPIKRFIVLNLKAKRTRA